VSLPESPELAAVRRSRAAGDEPLEVPTDGPLSSPDALHAFIEAKYGISIPRRAVCLEHGHCSPMDALYQFVTEQVHGAVWLAPRSGSKTMLSALVMLLNTILRPGTGGIAVGATEMHAKRIYDRLRDLLRMESGGREPQDHPDVRMSIESRTTWENGSVFEIVPSTMQAVNGPHYPVCLFDERELANDDVFEQSRNIAQSTPTKRAQNLITSTMKRAHGAMSKLVAEIRQDEAAGVEPTYRLFVWCWKEVTQNQAHCCRVANPDLPDDQKCNCDRVVKGTREDGSPRTFMDECGGSLARADGFLSLEDMQSRFKTNSRDMWESELCCLRPSTKGVILADWNRTRHGVKNWDPNPEYGPVFGGLDFGGTEPHCYVLVQLLRDEHTVRREGIEIVMPANSLVVFDSLYRAEIGLAELGDRIDALEDKWRTKYPDFRVAARWADSTGSGKVCRQTLAERRPRPIVTKPSTKDVAGSVTQMRELVAENRLFVDLVRAPMLADEIEAWSYKPNSDQPLDDFDHAVSATRYCAFGVRQVMRQNASLRAAKTGSGPAYARQTGYSESPWASSGGIAAPPRSHGVSWQSIRDELDNR
jgi:hypothetical protein